MDQWTVGKSTWSPHVSRTRRSSCGAFTWGSGDIFDLIPNETLTLIRRLLVKAILYRGQTSPCPAGYLGTERLTFRRHLVTPRAIIITLSEYMGASPSRDVGCCILIHALQPSFIALNLHIDVSNMHPHWYNSTRCAVPDIKKNIPYKSTFIPRWMIYNSKGI